MKFDESKTTDDKRLVRGEHLLYARTRLRIRDQVHHKKWRVLMLAGGNPAEEIRAIRELMPQAHIVATDRDEKAVELAIQNGADHGAVGELADFGEKKCKTEFSKITRYRRTIPKHLACVDQYDLVDLDFCGNPTSEMKDIIKVFLASLASYSVLIVTFSYGRDVAELFIESGEIAQRSARKRADESGRRFSRRDSRGNPLSLFESGVPASVLGRIAFLFSQATLECIHAVSVYRGSAMPMCSIVIQKGSPARSVSFLKVGPGDFEIAVCYPDSANLYACPQERIESLRRTHAAIKARATMKENEEKSKAKQQDMFELTT